jgi:hypothetical protein
MEGQGCHLESSGRLGASVMITQARIGWLGQVVAKGSLHSFGTKEVTGSRDVILGMDPAATTQLAGYETHCRIMHVHPGATCHHHH